jgi:hypothetical protein
MPFTIEVIFLDYLLHGSKMSKMEGEKVTKRAFPWMILDKETRVSELEGEWSLETSYPYG